MTKCLDVDDPATWRGEYDAFLPELGVGEYLEAVLQDVNLNGRHQRFSALARCAAPPGADPEKWLRDRVGEFFPREFTHVALYHACRIVDPSSYYRDGLLPSNVAALTEFAKSFFGESSQLDAIVRELRTSGYVNHNNGRIGLFFARSGAIHIGNGYHARGSEFLQCIANRLGPDQAARLNARGRPALIRCELSVHELNESDVRVAAALPLEQMLTMKDEAPQHIYAIEGGTMHSERIPPSAIAIEFLDDESV